MCTSLVERVDKVDDRFSLLETRMGNFELLHEVGDDHAARKHLHRLETSLTEQMKKMRQPLDSVKKAANQKDQKLVEMENKLEETHASTASAAVAVAVASSSSAPRRFEVDNNILVIGGFGKDIPSQTRLAMFEQHVRPRIPPDLLRHMELDTLLLLSSLHCRVSSPLVARQMVSAVREANIVLPNRPEGAPPKV